MVRKGTTYWQDSGGRLDDLIGMGLSSLLNLFLYCSKVLL
jgi:hypothetical protein